MSFFAKLFGSNDEKKEEEEIKAKEKAINAKKKTQKEAYAYENIEIEKSIADLEEKINTFYEQERKLESKVYIFKQKAKYYVEKKNLTMGKKMALEATKAKKLSEQYAVRRNILEKQKDTLITGMINGQVISSVEGATDRIKKMEEYSARLEDVITNHEYAKANQQIMEERMKSLAYDEYRDNEVDDMMKEIYKDIEQDKKLRIPTKGVDISVPTQASTIKQTTKNYIADLLANL